jgi:signal transduction histidine kinase
MRDITERKRAEQKVFEYQKRLKQLTAKLMLAEERERRHIAGEIHDEISQTLAMAKIKLDTLLNSPLSEASAVILEEINSSVKKVIQETRTLTFELSNPILYELGFEAAVAEWLNDKVQKKPGIATEFHNDGLPKPLDDDLKVMLFRNVRELLTNCIKHASAGKIMVGLHRIDDSIQVIVEDNGVGFDTAQLSTTVSKKSKFGLFSIRENMENTDGRFEIESKPGAGCKAIITAPLKNQINKKEV